MGKVNILQKAAVAAGAVLAGLRVLYPVHDKTVGGLKFNLEEGLSHGVDWNTTLLHIGGIVIITVAAFVILKKR